MTPYGIAHTEHPWYMKQSPQQHPHRTAAMARCKRVVKKVERRAAKQEARRGT